MIPFAVALRACNLRGASGNCERSARTRAIQTKLCEVLSASTRLRCCTQRAHSPAIARTLAIGRSLLSASAHNRRAACAWHAAGADVVPPSPPTRRRRRKLSTAAAARRAGLQPALPRSPCLSTACGFNCTATFVRLQPTARAIDAASRACACACTRSRSWLLLSPATPALSSRSPLFSRA